MGDLCIVPLQCHSIWLDGGELAQLMKKLPPESVSGGSPSMGFYALIDLLDLLGGSDPGTGGPASGRHHCRLRPLFAAPKEEHGW